MNRLLMTNWLRGIVVGTILVAVTSPLFVRSYLPREIDPIRGVAVMPAGATYRWRFEGYADSHIGPLGMVGKTDISEPTSNTVRIALWGDSQAEGVCVPDRDKLFKQLERRYAPRVEVFPLARSGDNVADWVAQIPAVAAAL